MRLPAISLHRTYLIARRDFLGYIRTWGFWISFLLPLVFVSLAYVASSLNIDFEPTRYETILDDTGEHGDAIQQLYIDNQVRAEVRMFENANKAADQYGGGNSRIFAIYKAEGRDAAIEYMKTEYPFIARNFRLPDPGFIMVPPPSQDIETLKSYVRGEQTFKYKGDDVYLSGFLHLRQGEETLEVNHWSAMIETENERGLYAQYFRENATREYFKDSELSLEGLRAAQQPAIKVTPYDPRKQVVSEADTQEVTFADSVPFMVAGLMTVMLWLTVFSGSYMLLTSMLEEKLNKLLEMMLASTRLSEIIFGKLLGVAALTLTTMLPYIILGVSAFALILLKGDPAMSQAILETFSPKMMIFFPIFLVLGYIFYGAFFIAMGTIANSMQDAQTMTTPIMLVLTLCFMVVPIGIMSPNAPILTIATYFPLSAPFASIIRLPSDPSWWELTASALVVLISAIGVIWLAGRVFTYGVLSGAGLKGVWAWFGRVLFRRKSAG